MKQRYNFWIKQSGQAPKWCSSRTNESGTMKDWIADLSVKYQVTQKGTDFLLVPRV